jgi:hypothetical protein
MQSEYVLSSYCTLLSELVTRATEISYSVMQSEYVLSSDRTSYSELVTRATENSEKLLSYDLATRQVMQLDATPILDRAVTLH